MDRSRTNQPFAAAIFGVALGLILPSPATAQPFDAQWTLFRDELGTSIRYPRGMLPVEGYEPTPPGPLYSSSDQSARLHVFTIRNERNETPGQFLRRMFPTDRRRLTYDRVASNFFAVSEPKDGNALYRRCNFSRDLIHCFDMRYPLRDKPIWDPVVVAVGRSLRPR